MCEAEETLYLLYQLYHCLDVQSFLFVVRWKHKKVLQYVDIVGLFYVCSLLAFFSVNRLGLEPKTPTLKVLCSTC